MFDVNPISEIKSKQAKEIVVFLPEQCPFRFSAPYYDGEEVYCSYLKSLHRWIEGCPLLNKDFIVVKN